MSRYVEEAYVTLFDDAVKLEYQGMGNQLRNCVRTKTGVVGETVQFVVYGKGNATPRVYRSPVQTMSPSVNTPSVVLQDFVAADYSDLFQQQKINFNEVTEIGKVAGAAIGRAHDQLIMTDGLAGSGTSNIITDGGDNMTFDKVLETIQYFNSIGVPEEDRYMLISSSQNTTLMQSDRLTNQFYVNNMILQKGTFNKQNLASLNFIVIPDTIVDGEAYGLPKIGDIRSCFAFHKQAVGFAVGIDQRTEINYVPQMLSWLSATILSAGAVAIDNTGIVEIQCDEAA